VPAQALVVGLDEADHEGTEHCPRKVADPTEHGRRERDQPELEPLVIANIRHVEGVQEAGGTGERTRDQEGERDRPVDVDAHHRRRVGVLGGCSHRLALPRSLDEEQETDEHGHGHEQDDQLVPLVVRRPELEDVAAREDVRNGYVVRPLPDEADVLQDEGHPDRRDQRRQSRGAS
jgi:hypothetical protein